MKSLLFALSVFAFSAHADDDDGVPKPEPATSKATWIFSYTSKDGALADPKGYVTGELAYYHGCFDKFDANKGGQVAGCEGNGLAAGPGIYTCDNPFTSHDYGSILLMMRTNAGDTRVANTSGQYPPASGGVDREVTSNRGFDSIVYDFRDSEFNGLAATIRDPRLIDNSQTVAIKIPAGDRKEWHSHDSFACSATTSIPDVLSHWGDQLEFLGLTFDTFRDPSGKNFEKNGQLNDAGIIAALASNVVAVPDSDLQGKIQALSAKSSELKGHLANDSCENSEHSSPRMCLAYELFDSIVGNEGTPNNPNESWSFPALKTGLVTLGILDSGTAAKLTSRPALMAFLAGRFPHDAHQLQRAQEAFGCMKAVRDQLKPGSFSAWAPASAPRDESAEPAAKGHEETAR